MAYYLLNQFLQRDFLREIAIKAENYVKNVCWYCKLCEKHKRFYSVRNELKKKGFNSFNKDVLFWDVIDRDRFTATPLKYLHF